MTRMKKVMTINGQDIYMPMDIYIMEVRRIHDTNE
mgnify:CR=1 FL=1